MALAVHAWPGPLPRWGGGPLLISTVTPGGNRDAARARIRVAVCEALAQSLKLGAGQVRLESSPGKAPRVLVDGVPSQIGVSISHAGEVSVAGVNPAGAVGVDLMEVQDISDWARVAHDYLGMATACRLAATAPAGRPLAFAQAWAEHEAKLKLFGLDLSEWNDLPAASSVHALALPAGFAGALALKRWCHSPSVKRAQHSRR
jgi:4'-phosphopantetheinyl transferase